MDQNDIFYINLDRVPERRAFVDAHFAERGLGHVMRWSATDGQLSDWRATCGYRAGTGERWGLRQSEIACFESHRRIWAHAWNNGLAAALIFEDDLHLSRDAADVVRRLMASPESFDVVKIDYSPKVLPYGATDQINGVNVRAVLETAPSAGGYIVSRSGCRKLLDWSQTYSDHLDDFIFRPRPNWRVFQTFPALAIQLAFDAPERVEGMAPVLTKSERTVDPGTNREPYKGPVWYRLRKEARNGMRKLKWWLWKHSRMLASGGVLATPPLADDLTDGPAQGHGPKRGWS